MKHIFISLFLSGSLFSVYAQNDSLNKTPVIRDSTPVTTNNTLNNVKNDSTGSMNNAMKSDSTASMNNTSQNIVGQPGYASLPILESYVPADVVAKVKSKHNSVYDISSIKHTADQTGYLVRYLDNGVYKTEII